MNDDDSYQLLSTFAGAPRTVRGRPSVIHADPKGKKFLYTNGNSVFIRDLENPSDCDVYTQHSKDTTVAAYSPSGYYICSGDSSGKIRIWDTINAEHILKYEYQVLSGAIKDIAWTEDSKRIAVCGEGRESTANVINWDTGTSCGKLNGPTKTCNQVSMKQNRPYRLVLVSEDYGSYFYEGVPFKLNTQFQEEHTSFVNCVRFSPDGEKYATAGADGKCFIHDGETGALVAELNSALGRIHKAGIYGIAWSPDGKHLMTASADKTVRIWVMDEQFYQSNKEAVVFEMGNEIGDMQVGCAWIGTTILSISLNGNINYLDCDSPGKPKRVIKGHTKAIIASCLSEDKKTLFTASFDGLIYYWDLATGVGELIAGNGHRNQVQNMYCTGDKLITCGMDDTVRVVSVADKKYNEDLITKMDSQPQRVAAGSNGVSVVACAESVVLLRDEKIVQVYQVKYEPKCVDINIALNKVAVGAGNSKVVIYDLVNNHNELKESGRPIPTNGNVTDIKFSPCNSYLAMCTGKKQVKIVTTADYEKEQLNEASHAVKVNAIAWSPDSKHVASCGVDGAVFTWNVEAGDKAVSIRGAHSQSVDVTSLQWSDNNTLLTTGRQDCSIKTWSIKK